MGTLSNANRFLDLIEKAILSDHLELKWPLWKAFIVSYARPFTSNDDIGSISTKAIPGHLKDLHRSFTKARSILYGHTDPLETLEDGGQANQIAVTKSGDKIEILPLTLVPHDDEIPRAKELVSALIEDLRNRTKEGREHLIAQIKQKPDGDYLFPYPNLPKNQDVESGRREILTPAPHTTGHTDP
jgi:hypothetical protein